MIVAMVIMSNTVQSSEQALKRVKDFRIPDFVDTLNPDPREDLESRSPNLGPYTTKGTL